MTTTAPADITAPPVRFHPAWRIAAVAALTIIVAGVFSTMPGLLVEPLHHEFAWSRGAIGFAVWVNLAANGLTAPFAAALMDRYGIRRVTAGALLGIGAGAALTTVMTDAWQLTVYWGLLIGLGGGALAMAFAAIVADRWFTRRRGLVTGGLTAASVFGQFALLPLVAWAIEQYEWRVAVATTALAVAAVLPLAWLTLRDHPADLGLAPYGARELTPKPAPVAGAASRAVRVLLGAARTGPFWLLAGAFAICGASTNGVMWTHFAPAAHDHGISVTVAASLLSGIGICNVVGTLAAGWLTDRLDPRHVLAVCYGLRGLSLLVLPLLLAPAGRSWLTGFAIVFGVLDVATVPPTIALARDCYGEDGPVVFGWVLAAHQVGAGLMAFGGGVARDLLGSYDPMWLFAGALCGIAVLLALALRRR